MPSLPPEPRELGGHSEPVIELHGLERDFDAVINAVKHAAATKPQSTSRRRRSLPDVPNHRQPLDRESSPSVKRAPSCPVGCLTRTRP